MSKIEILPENELQILFRSGALKGAWIERYLDDGWRVVMFSENKRLYYPRIFKTEEERIFKTPNAAINYIERIGFKCNLFTLGKN